MPESERTKVEVSLETDCNFDGGCAVMAGELYRQLGGGAYTWPMAVLSLDRPFSEYLASLRTARKRANRCALDGYVFSPINRHQHNTDIHRINTSLTHRQGREMSAGYLEPPSYAEVAQPCERHRVNGYGVFAPDKTLVAYSFIYRAGELALVSQILGHGEHLNRYVMFLLLTQVYRAESLCGGWLVYNRWDSGTEGLQQFKRWLRFEPVEVDWQP